MPEGHTIHRLAQDLSRDLAGSVVSVSSPQGRFTDASTLNGQPFSRAFAIGKHLFLDVGNSRIHIHLGLFGRFRKQKSIASPPRDTTRLRLATDLAVWDLSGPTACERIDENAFLALSARIGADPLATGKRPAAAWTRFHGSKRPVGALLLDQSIFSGIGNVYRAEILFLAGVHPTLPGKDVPKPVFEVIWKLSKQLLTQGVRDNRIVTVVGATRRTKKKEALYVYKQRTCRECKTSIANEVMGGRPIYFCPTCQPSTSTEE